MEIRACLFDVFGTVVDWRTSVSRDLTLTPSRGVDIPTLTWRSSETNPFHQAATVLARIPTSSCWLPLVTVRS